VRARALPITRGRRAMQARWLSGLHCAYASGGMSRFDPDPKSLRTHPVPAWFEGAKSGSRALESVVHSRVGAARGLARRHRGAPIRTRSNISLPTQNGTGMRCAFRGARPPRIMRRSGATRRTRHSASRSTACCRAGIRTLGGALCKGRRAIRRARHQASRRLLLWPTSVRNPHQSSWAAARGRRR